MQWKAALILSAILAVYLFLGGVAFHFIEGPNEETTQTETREFNTEFLENFPCVSEDQFESLVMTIIDAYNQGIIATNGTTSSSNWDYHSSLFFSLTIVTTIGYGNISPATGGGRIFCVFYALFGIPMMLVLLAHIGDQIGKLLKKLETKITCAKSKPKLHKFLVALTLLSVGFLLLMLIPAIIFAAIEEEWNLRNSLYYTYITLTTIGFGDYVAGTGDYNYRAIYRWCIMFWILIGLSWMSSVISTSQDFVQSMTDKTSNKLDGDAEKADNEKETNGSVNVRDGKDKTEEAIKVKEEKV